MLNHRELIVPKKEFQRLTKIIGGKKMNQTPAKSSYESAKETIKKYEERQNQLKGLEKELSKKIQLFQSVNFRVDKKKGSVIFAGSKDGRTLIGLSQCNEDDKFELVIGKLIAIKKALKEDVEDVVKLVESKSSGYVKLPLTFELESKWLDSTTSIYDKR